eukprot:TRINITY_DN55687_c0_g2_i1.p1 TRINITY_DN55687_c0_g2~~TRINITY_DN55687_c0_g2_i1.p1  ORF type:complete len:171 (+),score=49.19 TRINITY_DN55687_c0_g2_i1:27-539(+)
MRLLLMLCVFFFFKQKTAYEMLRSLVGSEMCIRDRLNPVLNTSSRVLLDLMKGAKPLIPNECKAMVDVKDVAAAHLLAFQHRSQGRHVCIGACPHWAEVAGILRRIAPGCAVPTAINPELPPTSLGAPAPERTEYSCNKLESLGLVFTDLESTVRETVESLVRLGFDSPQ